MKAQPIIIAILFAAATLSAFAQSGRTYPIVDTHQEDCYNNTREVAAPVRGAAFYGQDAQHDGLQPSYTDNGDGTITDNVTGLMWQKGLVAEKLTFAEALAAAKTFSLAGYDDWRLPSIKEIYSLMDFSGITGKTEEASVPYIDTDYFEFRFGGTVDPTERFIDAQYATTAAYVEKVFGNQDAMFGLNLADGRIKGYPQSKTFDVRFVRGNPDYGINDFTDNGDGTVTDNATGLMWDKNGSSDGMNWEDALAWVQDMNNAGYLGYTDWRLPNAKELQSILDYSRSPGTTGSAAIDAVFSVPQITVEEGVQDYPFYWTSTTHYDGPQPSKAVYICFGRAYGYMEQPPNSGNYTFLDVHGAGAQRSDPKTGNPDDYPNGHGPQGDVIRIYNYVRPVRDAGISTGLGGEIDNAVPENIELLEAYPNPSPGAVTLSYQTMGGDNITLDIYNSLGVKVASLVNASLQAGSYTATLQAFALPTGTYIAILRNGTSIKTTRLVLTSGR